MKAQKLVGLLLILFCIVGAHPVFGQDNVEYRPLVASVFDNATLLPGGGKLGIIGIPVHPGLSIGTEFRYNQNARNEWFQTAKFGYHYHRYVQHSVQLYSELGYRRHFKGQFDAGPRLGVGYLHSIPDMQIFELDDEGIYQKQSNWGKPQFMATFSLEAGYTLAATKAYPLRLFLAYQFYLQMPFVQEYVPLMPNTALHIGVALPLFRYQNESR